MQERERKGNPPGEQDEVAQPKDREQAAKPEDFEEDPARNPDDEALKGIKGG
jgi:hypothetical protein